MYSLGELLTELSAEALADLPRAWREIRWSGRCRYLPFWLLLLLIGVTVVLIMMIITMMMMIIVLILIMLMIIINVETNINTIIISLLTLLYCYYTIIIPSLYHHYTMKNDENMKISFFSSVWAQILHAGVFRPLD